MPLRSPSSLLTTGKQLHANMNTETFCVFQCETHKQTATTKTASLTSYKAKQGLVTTKISYMKQTKKVCHLNATTHFIMMPSKIHGCWLWLHYRQVQWGVNKSRNPRTESSDKQKVGMCQQRLTATKWNRKKYACLCLVLLHRIILHKSSDENDISKGVTGFKTQSRKQSTFSSNRARKRKKGQLIILASTYDSLVSLLC